MSSHSSRTATADGIREAVREARVGAALAMLTALLLLVNGLVSRSQGWRFPEAPWWAWIVLAMPEVLLLILLVVSALGDVRSAGTGRSSSSFLLGSWALASLTTGLLIWALADGRPHRGPAPA